MAIRGSVVRPLEGCGGGHGRTASSSPTSAAHAGPTIPAWDWHHTGVRLGRPAERLHGGAQRPCGGSGRLGLVTLNCFQPAVKGCGPGPEDD